MRSGSPNVGKGPYLLACALLLFAAQGCGSVEEDVLSNAEREEVAQRYADSVRTISARVDSLCLVNRPGVIAHLADSLVELRLADIERQKSQIEQ